MRRLGSTCPQGLPLILIGLAVVGCRGGVKSGAQGTDPNRAEAPADKWTLRWGAHDRIAAKSVEHLLALHGLKPASGLGGSMLTEHAYGFTGDEARRARDIFTHDAIWPELAPGVEHVVDLGVHTTRTPELRDVSVETAIAWLHAHHPPAVEILRDPRVVARGSNPRIRRLHVADRTYVEADGRRRPACDLDVVSEADDGRVRREATAQAVPAGDGWTVELVRSGGSWAAR